MDVTSFIAFWQKELRSYTTNAILKPAICFLQLLSQITSTVDPLQWQKIRQLVAGYRERRVEEVAGNCVCMGAILLEIPPDMGGCHLRRVDSVPFHTALKDVVESAGRTVPSLEL
jgi:hypothetical protein